MRLTLEFRGIAHKISKLGDRVSQARTTLPALMQEVHTLSFLVLPPPAGVRTDWMFGFQRRFVFFFDHGTL